MYWLDDDRDYIPWFKEEEGTVVEPPQHSVSSMFEGYDCPHNYCEVLAENHDLCLAVRVRLDAIAGEPMGHPDFLGMFSFNIIQWMKKKGYESFDSIPS